VCVSASGAAYIWQVQRQLDIVEPFVCQGGATLYVPKTFLCNADRPGTSAERAWEMFTFHPPDRMAAVTLVRDLFVARGEDPVTIGIGCDRDDYGILAVVDLPIVVRDAVNDQSVLRQYVPGAYVTKASGPAGWCEALIGRD
jgi:predicted mannosyl-3-phosphoglycerate phosphatase (HAD superfamily)